MARDYPEEIRRDQNGQDWTFGRGCGRDGCSFGGGGRGGKISLGIPLEKKGRILEDEEILLNIGVEFVEHGDLI